MDESHDRHRLAVHEAGHVLVVYLQDLEIDYATIESDRLTTGFLALLESRDHLNPDRGAGRYMGSLRRCRG